MFIFFSFCVVHFVFMRKAGSKAARSYHCRSTASRSRSCCKLERPPTTVPLCVGLRRPLLLSSHMLRVVWFVFLIRAFGTLCECVCFSFFFYCFRRVWGFVWDERLFMCFSGFTGMVSSFVCRHCFFSLACFCISLLPCLCSFALNCSSATCISFFFFFQ